MTEPKSPPVASDTDQRSIKERLDELEQKILTLLKDKGMPSAEERIEQLKKESETLAIVRRIVRAWESGDDFAYGAMERIKKLVSRA
jgi:5-bromo-4-chloroindolyl phosphate hydrolysis protein